MNEKRPQALYQKLIESGISVFWMEDFNAWLVTDREAIYKYCSSEKTTSKRDKLGSVSHDNHIHQELKTFYSHWLMYDEGDTHYQGRQFVIDLLKNVNLEQIEQGIVNIIEQFKKDIILEDVDFSSVSSQISSYLQSEIVSLDYSTTFYLLSKTEHIVKLIGLRTISEEDLIKSYEELLLLKRYESHFVNILNDKVRNDLSNQQKFNICCNLLLDGHKSLMSGLNNSIATLLNQRKDFENRHIDEIFEYIISKEVPFQNLSRVVTEDIVIDGVRIRKGDKILLSIGAYNYINEKNECPYRHSNLSFGYGKHYCVGAKLSKQIICKVITLIKDINLKVVDIQWEETVGYRSVEKLILKSNKGSHINS